MQKCPPPLKAYHLFPCFLPVLSFPLLPSFVQLFFPSVLPLPVLASCLPFLLSFLSLFASFVPCNCKDSLFLSFLRSLLPRTGDKFVATRAPCEKSISGRSLPTLDSWFQHKVQRLAAFNEADPHKARAALKLAGRRLVTFEMPRQRCCQWATSFLAFLPFLPFLPFLFSCLCLLMLSRCLPFPFLPLPFCFVRSSLFRPRPQSPAPRASRECGWWLHAPCGAYSSGA